MEVRARQPSKAPSPILVIEEGMFMEVRELQPPKAVDPILVTEEGMFMKVRELQSRKASFPILVTQDGISYLSKPNPARIRLLSFLLNNTLFSELYIGFDSSTVMAVRALQPSKALPSILVTEKGMFMAVRERQPKKALFPILVTEEGMFMEVRERQSRKAALSIPETRYPLTYSCISAVELFLSARPTTTAFCSCSFTSYLTPLSTTSLAHEGRAHSIPTITKRQWRTSACDLNDLILFMFCRLISRPFRVPHPPKRMRPPTRDEVILLLDLRNCLLLIVKLFVL